MLGRNQLKPDHVFQNEPLGIRDLSRDRRHKETPARIAEAVFPPELSQGSVPRTVSSVEADISRSCPLKDKAPLGDASLVAGSGPSGCGDWRFEGHWCSMLLRMGAVPTLKVRVRRYLVDREDSEDAHDILGSTAHGTPHVAVAYRTTPRARCAESAEEVLCMVDCMHNSEGGRQNS